MTKDQERAMEPGKRYWVGCDAANAAQTLVQKHVARVATAERRLAAAREELRVASRRLSAARGVCPDCHGGMTVDPACEVSDPPHDGRRRIVPAALCGTCDTCIEL